MAMVFCPTFKSQSRETNLTAESDPALVCSASPGQSWQIEQHSLGL